LTDRLFPIFVKEGRSRKRYKAGYINCVGNIVIPPTFQHAYPFRNGVATVRHNGLWGAINPNGEFVIPPTYTGPLIFTEGLASFSAGDVNAPYKVGAMSLTGEILIKPRYRSISHFSGGLACVYTGELYGYIDRTGNQVIPPFFEDARNFSEGVAAVKINGAWGYIHPDGSTACVSFASEEWRGPSGRVGPGLRAMVGGDTSTPMASLLWNPGLIWPTSSLKEWPK
jgi:WG containing repeat